MDYLARMPEMDEYELLAGTELVIDNRYFGKTLPDIMADNDLTIIGRTWPSDIVQGFSFAQAEDGIVLIHDIDERVVGAYAGLDVAIDPEFQGRGLGAELILEAIIRNEGVPNADCDTSGYTSAGYAAHLAAQRLAQTRPSLYALKIRRSKEPENQDKIESMIRPESNKIESSEMNI
jgi:GNAT superfamily N-acetyltransferase